MILNEIGMLKETLKLTKCTKHLPELKKYKEEDFYLLGHNMV
jgi:hypothetical protein